LRVRCLGVAHCAVPLPADPQHSALRMLVEGFCLTIAAAGTLFVNPYGSALPRCVRVTRSPRPRSFRMGRTFRRRPCCNHLCRSRKPHPLPVCCCPTHRSDPVQTLFLC
jgi:hypothetical protein